MPRGKARGGTGRSPYPRVPTCERGLPVPAARPPEQAAGTLPGRQAGLLTQPFGNNAAKSAKAIATSLCAQNRW
ncbi:hypothetical protein Cs7R123_75050 [Catellatospora sp. TT07R-123]|nr:hypothetical protein Cs7R123_75050 [Catellatospora sp. TT07R-123]